MAISGDGRHNGAGDNNKGGDGGKKPKKTDDILSYHFLNFFSYKTIPNAFVNTLIAAKNGISRNVWPRAANDDDNIVTAVIIECFVANLKKLLSSFVCIQSFDFLCNSNNGLTNRKINIVGNIDSTAIHIKILIVVKFDFISTQHISHKPGNVSKYCTFK